MKRANFILIIKLRSIWKIDKRRGNYKLPNGEYLSKYVTKLVETQMQIDDLVIGKNGELFNRLSGGEWNAENKRFDDYVIFKPFNQNETCTYEEMERRIKRLISEIIG